MSNTTKALFFDLDDTLLTSGKLVSEENALAISKCKSAGMIIGYLTARSPRMTKTYLGNLPCDCIAYYNGASLVIGNSILEKNEIPYSLGIKTMIEIQNAYNDILIGAYLEPYNYFNGQIRNINTRKTYAGTIMDLPEYDIQRIRIEIENHSDIALNKLITSDMNCFFSKDKTAIITSKWATKENALCKFVEYFNIDIHDVIAFGDDTNDVEMIKNAGIGIAMGNAIDEVKLVSNFVCDSNDNDGIAKWINRFLL